MDQKQKDRLRNIMLLEDDPVVHWIARRLPWSLVRAVVILACRGTGRAGLGNRDGYVEVSAEDVLGSVLEQQDRAKKDQ